MAELSHKSVRSKGVLENCMVRRALPFGLCAAAEFPGGKFLRDN